MNVYLYSFICKYFFTIWNKILAFQWINLAYMNPTLRKQNCNLRWFKNGNTRVNLVHSKIEPLANVLVESGYFIWCRKSILMWSDCCQACFLFSSCWLCTGWVVFCRSGLGFVSWVAGIFAKTLIKLSRILFNSKYVFEYE